jgi:hypothetical protein
MPRTVWNPWLKPLGIGLRRSGMTTETRTEQRAGERASVLAAESSETNILILALTIPIIFPCPHTDHPFHRSYGSTLRLYFRFLTTTIRSSVPMGVHFRLYIPIGPFVLQISHSAALPTKVALSH